MYCFLWTRGASTTFHKTMGSSPQVNLVALITTRILAIGLTWRSRSMSRFPRSFFPVVFASQTLTCLWQKGWGKKIYWASKSCTQSFLVIVSPSKHSFSLSCENGTSHWRWQCHRHCLLLMFWSIRHIWGCHLNQCATWKPAHNTRKRSKAETHYDVHNLLKLLTAQTDQSCP